MPRKRLINLERAQAETPPVNPVEALRRNLLYAMLGSISEQDMQEIVGAQVAKAKSGDARSARLIIDMVSAGADQRTSPTHMQQAVIVQDSDKPAIMSELRRQLVILIAEQGPLESRALSQRLHTPLPTTLEALDGHAWFEKEADGWHITEKGRAEALPMKEDEPVAIETSKRGCNPA